MTKKLKYERISMKCTEEQFQEIELLLRYKFKVNMGYQNWQGYLINDRMTTTKPSIGQCSFYIKNNAGRIQKGDSWDKDVFLNCCKIYTIKDMLRGCVCITNNNNDHMQKLLQNIYQWTAIRSNKPLTEQYAFYKIENGKIVGFNERETKLQYQDATEFYLQLSHLWQMPKKHSKAEVSAMLRDELYYLFEEISGSEKWNEEKIDKQYKKFKKYIDERINIKLDFDRQYDLTRL